MLQLADQGLIKLALEGHNTAISESFDERCPRILLKYSMAVYGHSNEIFASISTSITHTSLLASIFSVFVFNPLALPKYIQFSHVKFLKRISAISITNDRAMTFNSIFLASFGCILVSNPFAPSILTIQFEFQRRINTRRT